MAHQRQTRGDHHGTQTLACCSCRSVAGRCSFGADFRLCMGWLARQASRLGLGCSKLLCWWARLLRLRRLLCAPIGPDTVGPPLAPRQSLLLSIIAQALRKAPARTEAFHVCPSRTTRRIETIFTANPAQSLAERKQFPSHGLDPVPTNREESNETRER